MPTDEAGVATSGHYFLRLLLVMLALLLVLSVGATFTVVDPAAAENGSVSDDPTFESFAVEFDAADPERPNDVRVRWTLSENATDVEAVRIAINNESGEPINLYRHRGPNVPTPFTVAEEGSVTADLHVGDLSTVELQLKVPPGNCERVDTVRVFVVTGNETAGVETASNETDGNTSADPVIERSVHCGKGVPGQFDVAIDDYDETVRVGESATVDATVRNRGDRETTQSVRFLVGGVARDRMNLTLGPNETQQVRFTVEPTAAEVGELGVAVESDDDRANRTIAVLEAPTPTFSVAIENTTAPVAAGETLTVTARVENTGNASGTQSIGLADFDGEVVDVVENVSLSAGESTTVQLNWSTNDSDTGSANVTGFSENETASAPVTVTTAAVDSVAITLEDSVLTTAENTSVAVEARFTNGTTRTVTDGAAITVSNETVATVDGDTVVARNQGSTHVVASFEEETDAEQLTVESAAPGDDGGGTDNSTNAGSNDGTDDSTGSGGSGETGDSSDSDTGDETGDSDGAGGSDGAGDSDETSDSDGTGDSTGADEPADTDEDAYEDVSSGENLTDTNQSIGGGSAGNDVGNEDAEPEPITDWPDEEDGGPEPPEDGPTPIHDEPDPDDDPDWPLDDPPSEDPESTAEPDDGSTEAGGDATVETTRQPEGVLIAPAQRRIAFLPLLVVLLVPVLIRARRNWT